MNYVTKIQNTIKETKNKYAKNPSVSPALLWEMIKLKVREASLSYAKQRKKERADEADEIEKTITTLERTIEDKNIEGQLREQLSDVLKSKPRPNDRNMPTQHNPTLLGTTCCVRLATVLRCVATCWVLLAQV